MIKDKQAAEFGSAVPALVGAHSTAEAQLAGQISALWSAHGESRTAAKRTREELRALRLQLGEQLQQMKTLLARSGRAGEWSAFLRGEKIPRATADRYVQCYEDLQNPPEKNCLSESIADPTPQQIREFFQKIAPKLRRILTTDDAVYRFALEMLRELPAADGTETGQGVLISTTKAVARESV